MRLTLQTFLTLDGVIQAPGGPNEDTEGGFEHGGWSAPYGGADGDEIVRGWFANADAFLLGRKTYDIFSSHWPHIADDPISTPLNTLPKYVASRSQRSLEWKNSSRLDGDVVSRIKELKAQPGNELQVHGSCDLAHTLIEHDLIDEYRLFTFPVHIGSGKKLFRDGTTPAAMRLLETKTTKDGVVISSYAPAGPAIYGSYELGD